MKITLKAARVNCGMTLKQAAKKAGVTYQTLSKYENDNSNIPYSLLLKLSEIYSTPVEYIFLGQNTDLKRFCIFSRNVSGKSKK